MNFSSLVLDLLFEFLTVFLCFFTLYFPARICYDLNVVIVSGCRLDDVFLISSRLVLCGFYAVNMPKVVGDISPFLL